MQDHKQAAPLLASQAWTLGNHENYTWMECTKSIFFPGWLYLAELELPWIQNIRKSQDKRLQAFWKNKDVRVRCSLISFTDAQVGFGAVLRDLTRIIFTFFYTRTSDVLLIQQGKKSPENDKWQSCPPNFSFFNFISVLIYIMILPCVLFWSHSIVLW